MSDFGDIEPADAFDVETVLDPEQVAIRLQQIRRDHGISPSTWSGLTVLEQVARVVVIAELIDWLRTEGGVR